MAKINVLESNIYNRISAGEVVERPASIVKELVENSIDAGATEITVEVEGGGISLIRVTDNGGGIRYEELKTAFLPHATSKISKAEDLDAILSLGFRGEALASIAAVSMVNMYSKTAESSVGGAIEIRGGEVLKYSEAGCADGTQIEVRNLFFNTPARAKFLKKPKYEEAEIANIMARFFLVNHEISLSYLADGKMVYRSNGTGLADAIFHVYGGDAAKNIISVQGEYGQIKLSGYIGKPSYTKPNRTYQTVSLNGRYIVNSTVAAAVHAVYAPYLMKRSYPFYVLQLTVPFESVDVNVHPNKLDVRFENSSAVYALLHRVLTQAVGEYNRGQIREFNLMQSHLEDQVQAGLGAGAAEPEEKELTALWVEPTARAVDSAGGGIMMPAAQADEAVKGEIPIYRADWTPSRKESGHTVVFRDSGVSENAPRSESDVDAKEDIAAPHVDDFIGIQTQEELPLPFNYRVLGQVFSSYILIESGDCMILIDQHAAHERLLFDEIQKNIDERNPESQSLLIPYLATLNPLECQFMKEQVPYLLSMGFSVEEFGNNAYRIDAVPLALSGLDLQGFLNDLISDMSSLKRTKASESIRDVLAQKACKAAVKAGMALSEKEIEILLRKMRAGSVLQCPHGRPVLYRVEKREIEKWFKRIV